MNTADVDLYKELINLDSKWGTSISEQFFWCLNSTTRKDVIQVPI